MCNVIANNDISGIFDDNILEIAISQAKIDNILPYIMKNRVIVLNKHSSQLKRLYSGVIDTRLGHVIVWIAEIDFPNLCINRLANSLIY